MAEGCAHCGSAGKAVSPGLVRHHVTEPWRRALEGEEFSFCENPACDVVYFSNAGQVFRARDLARPPAEKSGNGEDLLCFCFDVTGDDSLGEVDPTPYVRERVRQGDCACDLLNPSGDCCLRSIGRWRNGHEVSPG